ncbi:MAG: glycosyltransferase family 4 protein [Bacteroidetes bacterium]|nr:glycosyltransferase family 4 protein [Bacteroidota bacterium]
MSRLIERILILSEDYPPYPGGIAQWARGMARGLAGASGADVRVLYRPRKEFKVPPVDSGLTLIPIQGKRWKQFRTWICRKAVRETISSGFRPDLIIATTWNVARGLTGLKEKHGFRLVLVVHGLEITRPMPALKRWWLSETLEKVDQIISVSRFTAGRLIAGYPDVESKVRVLPNGVDPADFQTSGLIPSLRQRFNPDGHPLLLTFARVIERKGHDTVIRALPAIIRETGPVIYLIAGKWEESWYQQLTQLVKDLQLESVVRFTGYVTDEEKVAIYQMADLYVMMSRELDGDTEGFGITYLEANVCGKPVIGGRSGGVADAIVDGETGFLVDPTDSDRLADRCIGLIKDPGLRSRLGENGRSRVRTTLTWQALATRFLSE